MKSSSKSIFFLMMVLMALCVSLVACAPNESECEKSGHNLDMDNVIVTVEPTCTQFGEGIAKCLRCGNQITTRLNKTEHDLKPDFNKTKVASCNTAGLDVKVCKVCKQEVKTVIEPLGHDFTGSSEIIEEATCVKEGVRIVKCSRQNCDGDEKGNIPAIQELPVPALDHDWQSEPVIDIEPTFEAVGKRSVHCTRCSEVKDEEEIPMLVRGQKVEYKFKVVRPNHEILKADLSKVQITIKDDDGKVVAASERNNFANGIMTVSLEPARYTATIEGLPEGYKAQQNYTISPGAIEKELTVDASLLPASMISENTKYTLGSVLHDYTFEDVTGKTVKLSELLATKKMVLLNFFFVTCGACQGEMPGLLSAYDLYKDDMAMIMLDVVNYDTPESIKRDWIKWYNVPDSVYVVQDMTPDGESDDNYNNICEKFGFTSAPQNIVIDSQGVVVYAEGGSTSEMQFRSLFKKYTTLPYAFDNGEQGNDTPQRTSVLPDVELPKRNEF